MRNEIRFIGVGSPHGDDQIGWLVTKELASFDAAMPVTTVQAPLDILDYLHEVNWIAICDACSGDEPRGSLKKWEWPSDGIAPIKFGGTHDLGLAAVLKLAETLGRLPRRLTVWGIVAGRMEPNAPPSEDLLAAVPTLARSIYKQLS